MNLILSLKNFNRFRTANKQGRGFLFFLLSTAVLLLSGLRAEDKVPAGEWQYPPGPGWVWVQKPSIFSEFEVRANVKVPAGHEFVSIIIEDATGRRIRNLLSMADVRLYGGDPKSGKEQTLSIPWNGLDDTAKQVPFGSYNFKGVSCPALKALFDYSWYNPGNPPYDGTELGGWGADHSGPTAIACAPPGAKYPVATLVTWATSEAIHQVIGLNTNATKVLGYVRTLADFHGPTGAAMDAEAAYLGDDDLLIKLNLQPENKNDTTFKRVWGEVKIEGKAAPNGLAVSDTLGLVVFNKELRPDNKTVAKPFRMATFDKTGFFTKKTPLSTLRMLEVGEFKGVASGRGDVFYLSSDQGVFIVQKDLSLKKLSLSELSKPGAIATDSNGKIYVMDEGPDLQVKVYTPEFKLERTIGRKKGQPSRMFSYALMTLEGDGKSGMAYDSNALHPLVGGIAVDAEGRLWVTEQNHPRRISVWDKAGKVIIEKFGGPNYAGANMALHESDPQRALANGIIWKIDPAQISSYRPLAYAYVPFPSAVEGSKELKNNWEAFGHDRFFSVTKGSNSVDYIWSASMGYPLLNASKNGVFVPVAAVAPAERLMEKPETIGLKSGQPVFWSDANANNLIESNEVQVLMDKVPQNSGGPFMGWVQKEDHEFNFYYCGLRIKPSSIGPDGIPKYDTTSIEKFGEGNIMLKVGDHYFGQKPPELYEVRPLTKLWFNPAGKLVGESTTPGMGVHGAVYSADLPRGQANGELFISGTASINDSVGSVMATAGYRGQQYLYTEDGILFYELLRSHRDRNQTGLPEKITKGYDLSDISGFRRQEAFNSWFGKQSDGVTRLLVGGGTEALVLKVDNLDKTLRTPPSTIEFTEKSKLNPAQLALRQKSRLAERPLHIKEWAGRQPLMDGSLEEWNSVEVREIFQGDSLVATLQLSFDSDFLYIAAEVQDSSPAQNADTDFKSCFRQGDGVEIQWGASNQAHEPGAKDVRLLIIPGRKKPSAVLFKPVDSSATPEEKVVISSPVRSTSFASVKVIPEVEAVFTRKEKGYALEAKVPLRSLGLRPKLIKKGFGDFGILFSDPAGQRTTARVMLFNKSPFDAGDAPSEAMILPSTWKEILFEPTVQKK